MSSVERGMVASDVEGMLGQLITLANAKDSSGAYLFAGLAVITVVPLVVAFRRPRR